MPARFSPRKKAPKSDSLRRRLGYNVLPDAGTPESIAKYFRYSDVTCPGDYELEPKAKDPTIVAVAQTNSRLIVTHDRKMHEYVRELQGGKKLHKCLNGSVLLPSGLQEQAQRLNAVSVGERPLSYMGIHIFWYEVWNYNLFVSLRASQWPSLESLCQCGSEAFVKHFRPT